MARRTKDVTITEDVMERDKGKTFRLTEMDAEAGEAWAIRAVLALTNEGIDFEGVTGMAAISQVGLAGLGKLKYETAKPLLDEMFSCVTIVEDPRKNNGHSRELYKDDVEEVSTRLYLRAEVFALHVGFSKAGDLLRASTSGKAPAAETSSAGPTSPP